MRSTGLRNLPKSNPGGASILRNLEKKNQAGKRGIGFDCARIPSNASSTIGKWSSVVG